MDIDVYHIGGWVFAIALTLYGLRASPNRKMLPLFLLAGIVLLIGAGQLGGFAVVEPRWHQSRYMFGFLITSIGLVLWALAFGARQDRPESASQQPADERFFRS